MYQLMFGLIYSVSLAREKINHQLVITAGTQIPTKILSEAFDPEDKTLCDVQTVPDRFKFASSSTVLSSDGNVFPLICGGCTNCTMKHAKGALENLKSNVQKACIRLTSNGKWERQNDMMQARVQFSLSNMENNHAVAVGGLDGNSKQGTKTSEIFDVTTGKWSSMEDLPVNIYGHCAVPYNQTFLIVLGGVQDGKVRKIILTAGLIAQLYIFM